jgi:hypothetical protein
MQSIQRVMTFKDGNAPSPVQATCCISLSVFYNEALINKSLAGDYNELGAPASIACSVLFPRGWQCLGQLVDLVLHRQ